MEGRSRGGGEEAHGEKRSITNADGGSSHPNNKDNDNGGSNSRSGVEMEGGSRRGEEECGEMSNTNGDGGSSNTNDNGGSSSRRSRSRSRSRTGMTSPADTSTLVFSLLNDLLCETEAIGNELVDDDESRRQEVEAILNRMRAIVILIPRLTRAANTSIPTPCLQNEMRSEIEAVRNEVVDIDESLRQANEELQNCLTEFHILVERYAEEYVRRADTAAVQQLPRIFISEEQIGNDSSSCSICREPFQLGEEARVMQCGHIYHMTCLFTWLEIRNTCPLCRFEMPWADA